MSLETDILQMVKELITRSKEIIAYAGVVESYEAATNIVNVTVDGANSSSPCTPLDDTRIEAGKRVVILKAGGLYYMVGALGNRVVHFPSYTGSNPSGTISGDAWYRDDLHQAFMNVNGIAVQIAP